MNMLKKFINKPFGNGLISTGGALSPRSLPPRLLVNRTGGAGGLSSSLDIIYLYSLYRNTVDLINNTLGLVYLQSNKNTFKINTLTV